MITAPKGSSDGARRLVTFIESHPWAIVIVALLLGVLSVFATTRLRIDERLRVLLPDHFPSIVRLDAAEATLGHQDDLLVAIRSPSRQANLALGTRLAAALETREDIRYALFRRDRTFFEEHALLYAELDEVTGLRRRVIEHIREQVRRQALSDLTLLDDREGGDDSRSELADLENELQERSSRWQAIPEYYEADEGRLVVIRARPTAPSSDVAFARALTENVETLARSLDPQSYDRHMEVEVQGAYAQHARRIKGIRSDVVGGSIAAFMLLLIALFAYFRTFRAIPLVLTPLVIAVLSALAFAKVAFGFLNLVSAFIFAVLLGLGIDFGIHVLARYGHERGRGADRTTALVTTLATTGVSTAAGAASTAASFAVLGVADFQGFAQFGAIAAVGVMLALFAAVLVMPAMIVLLERHRPWRGTPAAFLTSDIDRAPHSIRRPRWPSFVILGLALAAAAWSVTRVDQLEFEYDFDQLGPPKRADDGPPRASYRDAVGKSETVAPALALASTPEHGVSIQRQLEALLSMAPEEVDALAAEVGASPVTDAPPSPSTTHDDGLGQGDDDEDDELFPFEDEDLENPRFLELERIAVEHRQMAPEVRRVLVGYGRHRLAEMRDRLSAVDSIHRFVPDLQDEKLEVIRDIRRRVADKLPSMAADDRRALEKWLPYLRVDRTITAEDLPDWVRAPFTDASGNIGQYVVIRTRGSKADYRNSRRIYDAYRDLHVGDTTVPVAADFFVLPEIFDAIAEDGPLVLALAGVVLVVTTLVLFRSVMGLVLVVTTVAVGMTWTAGAAHLLGWKLNFFNIIAIPLLVGMSEDDALHLFHRYREERTGDVRRVLRETGGAIFMTTLTTAIGFGGILFADHRGLLSLAHLSVIGISLALLATIVVMPTMLQISNWLRSRANPPRS